MLLSTKSYALSCETIFRESKQKEGHDKANMVKFGNVCLTVYRNNFKYFSQLFLRV